MTTRDRQREPRGQLRLQVDTAITGVRCPRCGELVYVPRDSNAERVDCVTCDARLVTRRDLEGCASLVEREAPHAG